MTPPSGPGRQPGRAGGIRVGTARARAAALVIVLLVVLPVFLTTRRAPLGAYDQNFYLGMAHDLLTLGRFTDGFAYAAPGPDGTRPPGMRFVPLYPAMLALAAQVEPGFRAGMDCVVARYPDYDACPNDARLVRAAQLAMLAAVYLMTWWMAGALFGLRVAWIALALAVLTAPYLMRSVMYVMTEMTALFLSTAATAAAVAMTRSPAPGRWALLTGLLLGLLTLTRPAFLYLALAVLLLGAARLVLGSQRARAASLLLAAALGFATAVGPWVLRNAVVLDRPALSFGYAGHTLVQRISYDAMSWREYGLSYPCGLPGGVGLGAALFGPGTCDRFGLDERPGTFYQIGTGPLMTETLQAAGGVEHHLGYLVRTYLLTAPLWHLMVTIPMALRGAWVNQYWGLLLFFPCLALTGTAIRTRNPGLLALTCPAWFMLVFNAAVAVNQVRYNLMLVPPYAIAGAALLDRRLARRPNPVAPTAG